MTRPMLYVGDRAYSSWSLRGWLMLRHAEIDFDVTAIALDTDTYKAELDALSPGRTVPLVRAGDLIVWDSLAIGEWAAERAPEQALWPQDAPRRAIARAASATMHAGFGALRDAAPMNLHRRAAPREMTSAAMGEAAELQRFWVRARAAAQAVGAQAVGSQATGAPASDGAFLFGRWSLADAMAAPYATRLRSYAIPIASQVADYVDALLSDPAFLEWEQAALADPRRLAHVDTV